MAIYRKRKRAEVVFDKDFYKNTHFSKYAEINDDFADNTSKMTYNEMCSYYVAMLCHNSSN